MRSAWTTALLSSLLACGPQAGPAVEPPPLAPVMTCTVVYGATIFASEIEAQAEGPSHTDACRAAALSVPVERRTSVEEVDGVSPLWLVSPADDRMPAATPGAAPSSCELEVAFDDGPSAEGTGEAESEEAARTAAIAQACAALADPACPPSSHLATVTRRDAAFRITDGVSSSTHRVTVRLRRARRRTGSGSSSESRAHACREAYRQACGGACPEGTTLLALDGVPLL